MSHLLRAKTCSPISPASQPTGPAPHGRAVNQPSRRWGSERSLEDPLARLVAHTAQGHPGRGQGRGPTPQRGNRGSENLPHPHLPGLPDGAGGGTTNGAKVRVKTTFPRNHPERKCSDRPQKPLNSKRKPRDAASGGILRKRPESQTAGQRQAGDTGQSPHPPESHTGHSVRDSRELDTPGCRPGQADPEVMAISPPLDSSSGTHLIPPWGTGIGNKVQRTGPCRLAQPRGTHQKSLDTRAIQGPGQTRREWGPLSRCHCGQHPENAAAAAPALPPQTGPQQAEEGTPEQPGPRQVSWGC